MSAINNQPNHRIHPLDALTKSELEHLHRIVQSHPLATSEATTKIYNAVLYEPHPAAYQHWKKLVGNYRESVGPLPRQAIAVVVLIAHDFKRTTYEVIVQLSPTAQVLSWKEVPGAQPNYVPEEFVGTTLAIRNDQRIIDKCAEYGFDMSRVVIEPWTIGPWKEFEGKRVMQVFFYGKVDDDDDCQYAHPIPVAAVVNVANFEVLELCGFGEKEDSSPVPLDKINYAEKFADEWGGFRKDMNPIEITQPKGASFQLDGYGLKWYNYTFRIGYGHREGIILQDICWHEKDGTVKELFRRICVNETFSSVVVVVPYGDPRWYPAKMFGLSLPLHPHF
ncbi:primary-amine oxidase [Synchytrium endobioticum]|uniref:Amine oxidase n=1 Tax=Synchytrium endobioticum TaxID=286115 RepID=A0A507CVD0_9FUNG|nr:primary-amine oxidase [Synchytrium endobioticum]